MQNGGIKRGSKYRFQKYISSVVGTDRVHGDGVGARRHKVTGTTRKSDGEPAARSPPSPRASRSSRSNFHTAPDCTISGAFAGGRVVARRALLAHDNRETAESGARGRRECACQAQRNAKASAHAAAGPLSRYVAHDNGAAICTRRNMRRARSSTHPYLSVQSRRTTAARIHKVFQTITS